MKDLSYYLTLYTLEGHETWRAHLGGLSDSFERQWKQNPKAPRITAKIVIKINRLTSELTYI
jgi:hypothetical protein